MHWSMEVAAEKIGVSKTSIARWENGEQKPRGTSLDLVCAAYGMSADELGLVDEDITGILQTHQDTQITNSKDVLPVVFSQDIADRRSFLQAILHSLPSSHKHPQAEGTQRHYSARTRTLPVAPYGPARGCHGSIT